MLDQVKQAENHIKTLRRSASSSSLGVTCYVKNAHPKFKAPKNYLEKVKLEKAALGQAERDLKALNGELNVLNTDLENAKVAEVTGKKQYYFVKQLLASFDKTDLYITDSYRQFRGQTEEKKSHRKLAINALMRGALTFQDVLTGICTKSTVTNLSDQCGLTTFGHMKYDGRLKKSISRASRASDDMVRFGWIEKIAGKDPVTNHPIGTIIVIKDVFLNLLGFSDEVIAVARHNKIENEKRMGRMDDDMTLDDLPNYKAWMIQEIQEKRELYHRVKRQRKSLLGMSEKQLRTRACSDILNRYGYARQTEISPDVYLTMIVNRIKQLRRLRADFLLVDDYPTIPLDLMFHQ